MSTLDRHPYRSLTPEELHVVIRRAHAERAQVIRDMLSALRSWLARLGERRRDPSAPLRTTAGR